LKKQPGFRIPQGDEIIHLYKENHAGVRLSNLDQRKLYFFMIDMMAVVEKAWNKTGSYSKVVTPSDEAFGIFLLQYYTEHIPTLEVLKRDAPREKRKKRLDGEQLQLAIKQYGDWQHIFRNIRGSSSDRPTSNPMMEIDGEIVAFINSTKSDCESAKEKKKKEKVMEEQNHQHRSVEDFCDLDSVPGDICGNIYEA